jgi:hypothetical protein
MSVLLTVVGIGVCVVAGLLLIGALWLVIWTATIPRRAMRKPAREHGVSEAYLRAVLANNDDWLAGRITPEEWECRAVKIACRFPQDSGIPAHLRECEGGDEHC